VVEQQRSLAGNDVSARVRVALVGCGRIARVHRSYLAELPEVELVGLYDVDDAARTTFAAEVNLPAYGTISELVSQAKPQVVHVLTPPATHAPLALELLNAGVNVLVEKPLALTTREADSVLEAARRAGRWVSVDHNRWFDPVVQQAAQALAAGRLGKLVGVEVFQGAEAGEAEKLAAGSTHWTTQLPGGILHNLAPHPLYLMRRFAGRMNDLHVVACSTDGGQLEEVRIVGLGEVAPALVTISLYTQPFMNRVALLGSEASMEVNLNNMTLIERRPRRLPKLVGKAWPNLNEAWQLLGATVRNGIAFIAGQQRFYPGIGAHLKALYTSVARGGPPPVDAEEGRDVVVWYDEILAQSATRAGPISAVAEAR
jgi:predicted dehydrogenase